MHRERTATVDLAVALPPFRGGVCLRTLAGDFLPAPLVACNRQRDGRLECILAGGGGIIAGSRPLLYIFFKRLRMAGKGRPEQKSAQNQSTKRTCGKA